MSKRSYEELSREELHNILYDFRVKKQKLSKQLKTVSNNNDDAINEIDLLNEKISDEHFECDNLTDSISKVEKKINYKESNIKDINQVTEENKCSILKKEIDKKLKILLTNITTLESKIVIISSDIDKTNKYIETDRKKLIETINNIEVECNNTLNDIKKLNEKYIEIEAEKKVLDVDFLNISNKTKKLSTIDTTLNKKYKKNKIEYNTKLNKIILECSTDYDVTFTMKIYNALLIKYRELKNNYIDLNTKHENALSVFITLKKVISKNNTDDTVSKIEYNKMKEERDNALKKILDVEAENRALKAERDNA